MKFAYIFLLSFCFLSNVAQQRHFHSTDAVKVLTDGTELYTSLVGDGDGYTILLDSISLTTHFEGKMMIKKKINENEFEVLLDNRPYSVIITKEQLRIQIIGVNKDPNYSEKLVGYYLD